MVESGYRQLIVLRHAKTEQDASSDRARKLTSRGRNDAQSAGRWLRDHDLEPDVVLTSPAARARATAEIVAGELSRVPPVVVVDELYGASSTDALDVVATVEDDPQKIAIVGHNPTMAELAYRLQREPAEARGQHLPTAGIAVLQMPGDWAGVSTGSAELVHWHVPRG